MKEDREYRLVPIGTVRNSVKELGRHNWDRVKSEVVIDPDYAEALDGIDEFSHVVVIFWMHMLSGRGPVPLKTHPQMRPDLPLVGIFATRSPVRPNPIGMTVVRLLKRNANVLEVSGLDAVDGTPVLDIKPHMADRLPAPVKMPAWVHKLHQEPDV